MRHGIVYVAIPELDGVIKQFDVQGREVGGSSVGDLFSLLEQKLTNYS